MSRRRLQIKADPPIADVPQLGQRASEIGNGADRHMFQPARGGFRERAREFRRMALGGDQRVDCEGRGRAQDRADIMRIGDLVEDDDEAAGRQFGDVDRRERTRLEQQSLMNGVARRAGGDFLGAHDAGLNPARGDVGAEPFRRRGRGVEADQLAALGALSAAATLWKP